MHQQSAVPGPGKAQSAMIECASPPPPTYARPLVCPARTMVSGNQVLNSWPSTGTSLFMAPIFWKNTMDCGRVGGGGRGRGGLSGERGRGCVGLALG